MNDLDDYQNKALETAIYPGKQSFAGLVYTVLKLNGEAGEVAEKVGKIIRDDKFIVKEPLLLILELGDVLWYIAACANELGFTLSDVAKNNIEKLSSRKARDKLSGSGDLR